MYHLQGQLPENELHCGSVLTWEIVFEEPVADDVKPFEPWMSRIMIFVAES